VLPPPQPSCWRAAAVASRFWYDFIDTTLRRRCQEMVKPARLLRFSP
jgi:hypothetical protein